MDPRPVPRHALPAVRGLAGALAAVLATAACAAPREERPALVPADPYRIEAEPAPDAAEPPAETGGSGGKGGRLEPAGVATSGFRRSFLAHPTGDPATSALLVERIAPLGVASGDEVVFRMRLANLTAHPLEDVVLVERLDPAFELSRVEPAPFHADASRVEWRFPRLEPNGRRDVELAGIASAGPALEHAVSADCRPLLASSVPVRTPDLRLHLAAPAEVGPCETLPLRITVTNRGRGPSAPASIHIDVPEGVTTADGARELDVPLAELAAGETRVLPVELAVHVAGAHALRATARTAGGRATSNVVTPVARAARPSVAIECDGPVELGGTLRCRIAARNDGDGLARDLVLELTPPGGVELVSAKGGALSTGGVVRWTLDRLRAGEEVVLEAAFVAVAPGGLETSVELAAPCGDPVRASVASEVLPRAEPEGAAAGAAGDRR